MEHVLHTIGHVTTPWAAAFRAVAAALHRIGAVLTRAGKWPGGRDRVSVPPMSGAWLREHVAASGKHGDAF